MKSRTVCISLILLGIIIILSIIISLSTSKNSTIQNANDTTLNYKNALIVNINYSTLWAIDIDTQKTTFLTQNWSDYFRCFDISMKKTVYLGSSTVGNPIKILLKGYPNLNQPGNWYPEDMAIDNVNKKVYVIDGWSANLNIFDMLSEHYNVVLSGLIKPKGIAIDPFEGFIFILQLSSILKSNMDGTSPKIILYKDGISAFSLEREEKRIYFAGLTKIESLDYKGNNIQTIVKISNFVTSLTTLKSRLYWINPPSGFEKSILWTCTIVNGNCENLSKMKFMDNAMGIKAYNFNNLQPENPCRYGNNDCEHMCILNSKGGRTCACTIGWQLKDNLKSCKLIEDFLLYVQGNFVRGNILDVSKDAFTEAILPVNISIASLDKKKNIDFDYDAQQQLFYFTDDWDTNKLSLIPGSKQINIGGEIGYNIYPAINWISKNLYYSRAARWDDIPSGNIVVRGTDKFSYYDDERTIFTFHQDQLPKSLVLHPNQGYIFFTVFNKSSKTSNIFRTNSDGSGLVIFGENLTVSVNQNALCIDYAEDRLYWFSADTTKIHHSTLNGSDLKVVDISIIKQPQSISVYKDWIYISNYTSVWRVCKNTGNDAIKLIPKFEGNTQIIYSAKVFSRSVQTVTEDHPCAIGKGGCERYCFAIPQNTSPKRRLRKICGCNDNEKLQNDGISCVGVNE